MVAEVEAPTSSATPDAGEMTRSPHQPIADQLAVESLPTGGTPLPTDFQNEPALLAPPNNTVEPFNSLSKISPSCGAVSSEPSCVEKHDYDIEKAETIPAQSNNPDDDGFYSSAMPTIPLSSDPNSQPNDLEDTATEIGGLQSAVIELQIQEGYLSPELPDAVTMATEGSASSAPPVPASEATLSSFSMPNLSCFLQAPIPHSGGTQLNNGEIQTTLVEPTGSMDSIEPAKSLPSVPRDIQPSSHSDLAPASEATSSSFSMPHQSCLPQAPIPHTGGTQSRRCVPSLPCDIQPSSLSNPAPARVASVEENQSPLHSEDHIRPEDYDPFDGSFPAAAMNRDRYAIPNFMPGQSSPSESSQIMRSRVQDYYPDEPIYHLPRYRQGGRYQGQRESSGTSELTYKRWPYGGHHQGQEFDVPRAHTVSNRYQRYCPVNDIPDDRPSSYGRRRQGPDYHGSNTDNFNDMKRPFEVRYQEQDWHLGNEESDDMPRSYACQYRGHDYWHGTNVLNDRRQPRRARYQEPPYGRDERNLGEAPQPYGSHYQRQEYWPEDKSCPVMPQSRIGHYQGQMDWLSDDIVDRAPPQYPARYQGRENRPSNDDFADVQRTEGGPANFHGNVNFADVQITERRPADFQPADNFGYVQRTEQGPACLIDNEDFAVVRRTEQGPANFLSNDSIHNMASQHKDQSQRPEFSHDAFPTNHELEYMHPQTLAGEFKGEVYHTTADPDSHKDLHGRERSCNRDYRFNHQLQSQKDQYSDAGSASKNENFSDTLQLTGQNRAREEKSSSQASDGAGCESGTLVCDNIVSGPNSLNVVIGERNQAGGRTGGQITGNRIIR